MKTQEMLDRKVKIITQNRRANHDFEVVQTIETGIILQGTEVKSLRQSKCSIQDAYATFPYDDKDELVLMNLHISPYSHGSYANHDPKRIRQLLVREREAIKLRTAVQEKGLTLIPMSIYFSGRFVKIELGLVKARRKYDKREAIKERDVNLDIRKKYRV
jgi:SsrA-binding protein